jgi:hypothetical protein
MLNIECILVWKLAILVNGMCSCCSLCLPSIRTDKCVLASSGFQADIKALQKNLSAKELVSLLADRDHKPSITCVQIYPLFHWNQCKFAINHHKFSGDCDPCIQRSAFISTWIIMTWCWRLYVLAWSVFFTFDHWYNGNVAARLPPYLNKHLFSMRIAGCTWVTIMQSWIISVQVNYAPCLCFCRCMNKTITRRW